MIRAVYRDGSIRPIDPVPARWSEGKELEIEEAANSDSLAHIDRWVAELEGQISRLDDTEDWSQFEAALSAQVSPSAV